MLINFINPESNFEVSEIIKYSSFVDSTKNNFDNIKDIIYPHLTDSSEIYVYDILKLSDEVDSNGDLKVKTWLKKRRVYSKWNGLNVFYIINWGDKFNISRRTPFTEDLLLKYGTSPNALKKTAAKNIDRLCMEIMRNVNKTGDISIQLEPRYKNIFPDIIYSHLFWEHLYKIIQKPFCFLYRSENEFEILDRAELEAKDEIGAIWGRIFFYTGSELRSLSLKDL